MALCGSSLCGPATAEFVQSALRAKRFHATTDCPNLRVVPCVNDSRLRLKGLTYQYAWSPKTSGHQTSSRQRWTVPSATISTEEKESQTEEGEDKPIGVEQEEEEEISSKVTPKVSVEEHVAVLKRAAFTKKENPQEVFKALFALEKMKLDPSSFLETIGGTQSPGKTWMLVFTADSKDIRSGQKGGEGGGKYFPVTAIQRFDAEAMEIENGVFLGPVGNLTFKGPMNWIGRRLPFTFNTLSIKIGSLGPFKINIGKKDDEGRKPGDGKEGSKDPFFTWFYADDEIIAARGRGGGTAFWVRCTNVGKK